MAVNQFLPFATGGGANVLTPSAYAALTTLVSNGFTAGVAPSQQLNTVWRQASFISAGVAQLLTNAGIDALDDGNLSTFVTNLSGLVASAPGRISYWAMNTPPAGHLKANGASLSTTTYSALFNAIGYTFGGSGGSFTLPDLRGEFIRGWDDARGIDSGRVFGSFQASSFASHTHTATVSESPHFHSTSGFATAGGTGVSTGTQSGSTLTGGNVTGLTVSNSSTGGTDTVPRNRALLACIKY